jgi:hypothetical protein
MTGDVPSIGGRDSGSPETVSQDTPPVRARRLRVPLPLAGGLLVILAAVVLAFLLKVPLGGSLVPQQPARTSMATPIPRILYAADWTQGTDGWTLPSHWHLVNGHLENDGYGTESLLIPYRVTVPNYSVAVDFTVEKVPNYAACHSYGIEGVSTGGAEQFLGNIACLRKLAVAYHGFSENYVPRTDKSSGGLSTNDFTLSFSTQTFTVQVKGNNVGFCPGVACLANLNSAVPLWPMQIAIYDVGVQMSISRIVISSP